MSDFFKGVTFANQDVTPVDDAILRRRLISDGVLTGCELTYAGYTLTMASGYLIACGRQIRHPTVENWAISDATSGYARVLMTIDLTRTATEEVFDQINTSIEYATSKDGFSALIQDDVTATGSKYQLALAIVSLGTGGITGIASCLAHARSYGSNYNLLDNSDFTNLVAQAGIGGNHGTIAYAADRWILDSGTVAYEAGVGLTLNGTIRQKIEHQPAGQTSAFVGMASGAASISYADGAVTITSSGGVIQWAALYEGEYAAETLPEYNPKGYGAELAECQRYYLRSYESTPKTGSSGPVMIFSAASGHAGGSVLFPTEMRVTPTVTLYNLDTGNSGVVCDWSNSADVTASASATRKGFFVRCGGKFTKGKYYGCHYEANADL